MEAALMQQHINELMIGNAHSALSRRDRDRRKHCKQSFPFQFRDLISNG